MNWKNLLLAFALLCAFSQAGQLTYNGLWGYWTTAYKAPYYYYLCGAQIQFQDYQGKDKDDTAVNGIKMIFCYYADWYQQIQDTFEGSWGTWKNKVMCPQNYFVVGMKVRFEQYQGSTIDDTALNGVKFQCKFRQSRSQVQIMIYEGLWGNWSAQLYTSALHNQLVNGYNIRSEPNQGANGDNSAINGISLLTDKWSNQTLHRHNLNAADSQK